MTTKRTSKELAENPVIITGGQSEEARPLGKKSEEEQATRKKDERKSYRLNIPKGTAAADRADVHIEINGKIWAIKRGYDVEVPEEVYWAYMDSYRQKEETADLVYNLEQEALEAFSRR